MILCIGPVQNKFKILKSFSLDTKGSLLRITAELYDIFINPLNGELNPICHLLALLGAHHILHISRIRINCS
jgi:hypothetical protein